MKTMSGNDVAHLRILARDVAIVKTIDAAGGYMTEPQLRALFFPGEPGSTIGPRKACQRRLGQLTRAQVLRHIEQLVRRGEGSKPYIYALGPVGAQLLATEYGIAPYQIDWRPRDAEAHYFFLQHILGITDVRIAVTLACKKHGLELETWQTDREIKRLGALDYVTLTSASGNEDKVAVIPDSYFVILKRDENGNEKRGRFFLELDRSTVTVQTTSERRSWFKKIRSLVAYFDSEAFQQRYEGKIVQVLTVVAGGQQRMNNLMECTKEAGGDKRFWFTTFQTIVSKDAQTKKTVYHDHLLTEPIWRRVGVEGAHALLAGA